MNYFEESLKLHKKGLGKVIVYTPCVADSCRKIFASEENVYKYT